MDVPPADAARRFYPGGAWANPWRMGLQLTLWLAAASAGTAVACGWRGARPPDPMRGPRLVPWRLLMALSACGALVLLVHLVNLLGFDTGR